MTYFERYSAGEHVRVWDELSVLSDAVRDAAVLPDAISVVRTTMERVAANIDQLIGRLKSHGYEFGFYPDGSEFPIETSPIAKPDLTSLAHVRKLETLAGTIPLSLKGFWEIVGCVSLLGRAPGGWPDYSDPLLIEGPSSAIAEFHDWQTNVEHSAGMLREPFPCPFAPDILHKDNVSGGPPYSIRLPDMGADAVVQDEWHNVRFVPYLRIAILEWGGFPGLSNANPQDKWRSKRAKVATPSWWKELTHNLVPF